jgi:hypothetical protein
VVPAQVLVSTSMPQTGSCIAVLHFVIVFRSSFRDCLPFIGIAREFHYFFASWHPDVPRGFADLPSPVLESRSGAGEGGLRQAYDRNW